MPSFDLVSKIDIGELKNVLNQTQKVTDSRYDFRGSKTLINHENDRLEIESSSELLVKTALDILRTHMGKRGIGMNAIEPKGEIRASGHQRYKLDLEIKQGINKDKGKLINKLVKESKLKVSSQYMDEKVRLSGKKIDDLQEMYGILKAHKDVALDLQMENMKR